MSDCAAAARRVGIALIAQNSRFVPITAIEKLHKTVVLRAIFQSGRGVATDTAIENSYAATA